MSKELIISLDDDIKFTHISYNSTNEAIENNVEYIVTPCTTFFNTMYTCEAYGYIVCARNKNKIICLNDMLVRKEVRVAQNVASMLLSGCFEVAPNL